MRKLTRHVEHFVRRNKVKPYGSVFTTIAKIIATKIKGNANETLVKLYTNGNKTTKCTFDRQLHLQAGFIYFIGLSTAVKSLHDKNIRTTTRIESATVIADIDLFHKMRTNLQQLTRTNKKHLQNLLQ